MKRFDFHAIATNYLRVARRVAGAPFKELFVRPVIAAIVRRYASYLRYDAFTDAVLADAADWQPEVVHAHDLFTLPAGAAIARRSGARLVYDSHELETHRQPPPLPRLQRFIERLERRHIGRCDGIITVSGSIADHLAATYGIERPAVVCNAPDLRAAAEAAKGLGNDSIRARLALSEDQPLVVYVGYVAKNRGLDVALEALARMPGVHLAALGPARPEVLQELHQLAASLQVTERFHTLEPVEPSAVVPFISTATVGIIPILPVTLSYAYCLPNKLFEMAFAGLPIAASRLVEIERFIHRYGLGETFAPGDAAECAKVLGTLIAEAPSRRPSQETHERLRSDYDWEAQTRVIDELYTDIARSDAGSARNA
jgi:glycosyltransferase involved in cell wall biosynthesis